jgi:hypothetical protein
MMANLDETQGQLFNAADVGENKYGQPDSTLSSMEVQAANIGMASFCSFSEAQESE